MAKEIVVKIGDRFNRWEIISEVFRKKGTKHVIARCECGTVKTKRLSSLTSPSKPDISCGCLRLESMVKTRKAPSIGEEFGRLTVISEMTRRNSRSLVVVQCSCGSEAFEARVDQLKDGNTSSCGCYHKDAVREASTTHGMTGTSAYSSWQGMKDRCTNPNNCRWERYGARGITFPEEWNSFEGFWADMSDGWYEGADIDRIDFDLSYYKENCRWVDRDIGNHNKSKSSGTSMYKGVYFDVQRDKWVARLNRNGIIYLQQRYESEYAAALAYDNCSEEIYGDRPNKTTRDEVI